MEKQEIIVLFYIIYNELKNYKNWFDVKNMIYNHDTFKQFIIYLYDSSYSTWLDN